MSVSDAREQPAAQPQKKRMSRGTRVLVIIVCVLLAIALILVATVLILSAVGRNALTNDDGVNIARDDVEALGSGTVRYNGQLYRYNTDIVTILLMGVDEEVKQDTGGVYGNANQSDANILAVLDMRNQELTLVSISRDAMCTLDVLDSTGAHVGTATAQLALAYSYGDGAERSCELTSAAVSRLFYDLPIPAYGSIYMQGIRQLVDSVGGVTVTPDASFSGFTAGLPVTLTGLRRGLAGIGIDIRIRVALLRAGNIAGSKRRRRQSKHKHEYQKNGHKMLHCVTPPFINLQLLIVA